MGKNLEKQYAFRCDDETIQKLEFIAKKHTNNKGKTLRKIYINGLEPLISPY